MDALYPPSSLPVTVITITTTKQTKYSAWATVEYFYVWLLAFLLHTTGKAAQMNEHLCEVLAGNSLWNCFLKMKLFLEMSKL